MRKLLVALIAAFLFAVWFLQYQGVIDFGVSYVIMRLWPIIPLWLGLQWLTYPEPGKKKSGFVLVIFAAFLLGLNIVELFTRSQDYIYFISITGILVFWPIIILVFFISIIISLFDKGETVLQSIFSSRTIDDYNWDRLDSSLRAAFGKLTFVIKPEDLTHRAIRLDILSFFGKVEVIIPEGVGVLAEVKTRLGTANVLQSHNKKIIGKYVVREVVQGEENPRVLLVTSSWFGNVTVRYANK